MQARHLFLLHIWRLDLAIQPSITAIPREPIEVGINLAS